MKIEPISVSELNRYMKDKVADDEYLKSVLLEVKFLILNTIIQVICTFHLKMKILLLG